jgi:hypothetical protein
VLFNPEYDPDTYSVADGQMMADIAVARGRMPREEAETFTGPPSRQDAGERRDTARGPYRV